MVGCDLIEIKKIKDAMCRTPRLRDRVFTAGEIAYCEARSNPYPSYAVRFAAKEAFRKLHASFVTGTRFHDIEVVMEDEGRPCLNLSGPLQEKARQLGISKIDISLSHDGGYAMAVALAIQAQGGWKDENCLG